MRVRLKRARDEHGWVIPSVWSLTITLEENGDTLLTGPVVEQAALYGLPKKVRDLGMPLLGHLR